MAKEVQGTIYECEYYKDNIPCGSCRNGNVFRTLSIEEMEKHEKSHQSMIAMIERQYRLQKASRPILARQLRIGEWDDWKELFNILVMLNREIHRQPIVEGQSLGIFGCGLGLIGKLEKFIWFQTKEAEGGDRNFSKAWDAIHIFYIIGNRRKDTPKDTSEHQLDLNALLDRLRRALLRTEVKFGRLKGMDELQGSIGYLTNNIQGDAATITKARTLVAKA